MFRNPKLRGSEHMEASSFIAGLFGRTDTYNKGNTKPILFTKYEGKMIQIIRFNSTDSFYQNRAKEHAFLIDQDILTALVTVINEIRTELVKHSNNLYLKKNIRVLTYTHSQFAKFTDLANEILRDVTGIELHVDKILADYSTGKDYHNLCLNSERMIALWPFEVTFRWPKDNEFVYSKEDVEFMIRGSLAKKRGFPNKPIYTVLEHNKKLYLEAKQGSNTDITFVIEDKTFHAHRSVIATHSETLGNRVSKESKVEINCASAQVFEGILEFIYLGALPATPQGKVTTQFRHELAHAARNFRLYEFSRLIEPLPTIQKENIVELFEEAHALNDRKMVYRILDYAERNFEGNAKLRESKSLEVQKYLNAKGNINLDSCYNKGNKQSLVFEKYRQRMIHFLEDTGHAAYKGKPHDYVYLIDKCFLSILGDILNTCRMIHLDKIRTRLVTTIECTTPKEGDRERILPLLQELVYEVLGMDSNYKIVDWVANEARYPAVINSSACYMIDRLVNKVEWICYWQSSNEFITSTEDPYEMIKAAVQGRKIVHDIPLHTIQGHNRKYLEAARAGKGTDMIFDVGGKMLTAHRAKVEAHFKFKTGSCYKVADIPLQAFEGILEFIYMGAIPETPKGANQNEFLVSVNKAARKLGLYELSRLIEPNPSLNIDTIVFLYKEAVASGQIQEILNVLRFAEVHEKERAVLLHEITQTEMETYMSQTIESFDNIRRGYKLIEENSWKMLDKFTPDGANHL